MGIDRNELKKRLADLNRKVIEETQAREERRQAKQAAARARKVWARNAPDDPEAPPEEIQDQDSVPTGSQSLFTVHFGTGQELPDEEIEKVLPGKEVTRPDGGKYWLVERRVSNLLPELEPFAACYSETFRNELPADIEKPPADIGLIRGTSPGSILYLDLETCGLASAPLFLVGVLEWNGEELVVRQHFARNYAEERHLLAEIREHLESRDLLITYNGKTYDVPFLRDRGMVNGVPLFLQNPHLDLLYPMRRLFRGKLPNCKLTTLERFLCGRVRSGDVPGAEIPRVYHEFVRTGNGRKMSAIAWHNAMDLVTMAEMVLYFIHGRKVW